MTTTLSTTIMTTTLLTTIMATTLLATITVTSENHRLSFIGHCDKSGQALSLNKLYLLAVILCPVKTRYSLVFYWL